MKLSLSRTCAGASFCYLEVKGVDQELKMALKIISHFEPKLVEPKKLGEKENLQTSEYKIRSISGIYLQYSTWHTHILYTLCTVFPRIEAQALFPFATLLTQSLNRAGYVLFVDRPSTSVLLQCVLWVRVVMKNGRHVTCPIFEYSCSGSFVQLLFRVVHRQ